MTLQCLFRLVIIGAFQFAFDKYANKKLSADSIIFTGGSLSSDNWLMTPVTVEVALILVSSEVP